LHRKRAAAIYIVIPHVGKSHLTYRLLDSIPEEHKVLLVDGSYVRDMSTLADLRPTQITYRHTEGTPHCLAHNWNLGTALVPGGEPFWMYCATDIEFNPTSWNRIKAAVVNFPDAGILKDKQTNWNVWILRRWAWKLLRPFDERYKPCGGEDDDVTMKCHMAGIKIKEGNFCVQHGEGGHATRIDIGDAGRGTTWDSRRNNIAVFRRKWGCIPSKGRDPKYRKAIRETHMLDRRDAPPESFTIPTVRPEYPEDSHHEWPNPLKLNLGCGIKPRADFVNVDLQSRCADFIMDIAKDDWPWNDGTVDRIESYHVLEHLGEMEGREVVARAFRVLKPGGVLVLECPDLEALCAKYPKSRRRSRWDMFGMRRWGPHQAHRFGYCGPTLRLLLGQAGFMEIKTGPGTDYHQKRGPCVRAEGVKP
jgi:hypothetical protein